MINFKNIVSCSFIRSTQLFAGSESGTFFYILGQNFFGRLRKHLFTYSLKKNHEDCIQRDALK